MPHFALVLHIEGGEATANARLMLALQAVDEQLADVVDRSKMLRDTSLEPVAAHASSEFCRPSP